MPVRTTLLNAPAQLRRADAALSKSHGLIKRALVLKSVERRLGLASRTYRQTQEVREALQRLDDALRAPDRRFTGVRRVERSQ